MLSVVWEGRLSEKTLAFLRLGALYVQATADMSVFDYSRYTLHMEESGFVPVVGLGGRYEVDDRWSVIAEGRFLGHTDVYQGLLTFQYTLNP